MPRNDSALNPKTHPAPAAATTTPPSAGPTARARFMFTAPSADACPSCSRSTNSGWMACHDGPIRAVPQPRRKVRASRGTGDSASAKASTVSTTDTANIANCAISSSARRSNRSASTPEGSASSTMGRLDAVCTSVTRVAPCPMSSHCAPTVCIHVPMFDTNCAIHRARNTGWANGAQADADSEMDGAGLPVGVVALMVLLPGRNGRWRRGRTAPK